MRTSSVNVQSNNYPAGSQERTARSSSSAEELNNFHLHYLQPDTRRLQRSRVGKEELTNSRERKYETPEPREAKNKENAQA